jgi:hypothetical protein
VQLIDKQVNLIFKLAYTEINEPVNIVAPTEYKSIQDLIDQTNKNKYDYSPQGAASIKAKLLNIAPNAELVYDDGGYGTVAFPLGSCKKTAGTLFADEKIYSIITDASGGDMSKSTCVSTKRGSNITSYAISVPIPNLTGYSWCVDSAGAYKQIKGSLTGEYCK